MEAKLIVDNKEFGVFVDNYDISADSFPRILVTIKTVTLEDGEDIDFGLNSFNISIRREPKNPFPPVTNTFFIFLFSFPLLL